jgi:hypothetical protein
MADVSNDNLVTSGALVNTSLAENTPNTSTSPHATQNIVGSASTSSTGASGSANVQLVDLGAFVIYLKQFVPALLDASGSSIGEFDKCLSEKSSIECIKKFIAESQVRTLIIQKYLAKGN